MNVVDEVTKKLKEFDAGLTDEQKAHESIHARRAAVACDAYDDALMQDLAGAE